MVPEAPPTPPDGKSGIWASIDRVNQLAQQRLRELDMAIPHKEQLEKGIITKEISDPLTGKPKVDPDRMRQDANTLKLERSDTTAIGENISRYERYIRNAETIETTADQLRQEVARTELAAKTIRELPGSPISEAADKELSIRVENKRQELHRYEQDHLPLELRGGQFSLDNPTEVEAEYAKEMPQWLIKAVREEQQKALEAIKEKNLPEAEKRAQELERQLEEEKKARELAERQLAEKEKARLKAEQELAREKQRADELARQLDEERKAKQQAEEAIREKEQEYQGQIRELEKKIREANRARETRAAPMGGEVDKSLPSALLYAEPPTPPEGSPENLRTTNDRRTERFLWWFSVAVGGSAGLVMEATGGWWINPIARAVITGVGAGAGVADLWIGWRERRTGADELQKRLRDYQKAAKYLRIVAGGIGTGIAAVSLSTMAIHAASEGIGVLTQAVTDRFTQTAQEQTQEKIAQLVGKEAATTNWLSKLDIRRGSSAWGTVHDLINNHQVPEVELWQAPTGNNSADVIAQWSTEIFPRFNHSVVDVIQPGTLDLTQHLQPDQVEFLGQLANTKDYNQYASLVKEFAKTHPDIAQIPEVARVLARK